MNKFMATLESGDIIVRGKILVAYLTTGIMLLFLAIPLLVVGLILSIIYVSVPAVVIGAIIVALIAIFSGKKATA